MPFLWVPPLAFVALDFAMNEGLDVPVLGEGRLMLEREPPQAFDLLAMDAFSGDSIPTHLLTLEAFDAYQRHRRPDGLLAVHITNTYLDLRPVMASAALHMGKVALLLQPGAGGEPATGLARCSGAETAAGLPAVDGHLLQPVRHPDLRAASAPLHFLATAPHRLHDFASGGGVVTTWPSFTGSVAPGLNEVRTVPSLPSRR